VTVATTPRGIESDMTVSATNSYSSHPAGGPKWRPPSHQRPLQLVVSKPVDRSSGGFTGITGKIWRKLFLRRKGAGAS
jgi:hypothetical protein